MLSDPEYRAMLAVDVERSSGRGNVAQDRFRQALFAALEEACAASRIEWTLCHREDLGDGMAVIFPPGTPKNRLLHPLVHELSVRLRAHNRIAGKNTRIRLRAAMHAGDVHVSGDRLIGRPIAVLARLLEAAPLREALTAASDTVPLALIVSGHVHDDVVEHGYLGIDPDDFRKVRFTVKEMTTDAWLCVPGNRLPATAPVPDSAATDPHARFVQYNTPGAEGSVYANQGGTQNFNLKDH